MAARKDFRKSVTKVTTRQGGDDRLKFRISASRGGAGSGPPDVRVEYLIHSEDDDGSVSETWKGKALADFAMPNAKKAALLDALRDAQAEFLADDGFVEAP